ncbi:MAG: hypothetical protein KF718_15150 [Polyangiaceae bacterium]|nr:hypothetical protein [Polyangiaceae bacterium]
MKSTIPITLAALVFATASSAVAEPIFGTNAPPGEPERDAHEETRRKQDAERFRPGFGARVGGYGFRNPDGETMWDACRMNGLGVFGTLDVNKHLYTELSVDFYSATPATIESGLDRTSTHTLVGVGLRMLPDFVLTPHVVLGAGAEFTRVELPRDVIEALYPMGYAGFGAELNVTRELKFGATVRMLATTRPEFVAGSGSTSLYGSDAEAALGGDAGVSSRMQFDVASQAQFFVRYAL